VRHSIVTQGQLVRMEDKQLIASALDDHRAFKILVERYYSVMLVVAKSIIGDSLAEEVVQEAWLAAYNNLSKFEGRSSLKTWLITIVSNEAKTRLRKESKTVSIGDFSDDESVLYDRFGSDGHWSKPPSSWHNETPDALLSNQQFSRCLKKYMLKLSEQARTALTLKDMHGLSLDEICNILGVTASNVRVLIHRSRHKIFEHIEKFQETGSC